MRKKLKGGKSNFCWGREGLIVRRGVRRTILLLIGGGRLFRQGELRVKRRV